MYYRETNPHFLPTQTAHLLPQHEPNLHHPAQNQTQPDQHQNQNLHPQNVPNIPLPRQQEAPPQHQQQPRRHKQSRNPRDGSMQPRHDPQYQSSSLRAPPPRKTKPITWFIAIFCTLFWIIIILGGLAILIVYLAFRPRSPRFDVSSATLNAAYLDMGYLLNADLTLLVNFTNPNKKMTANFNHIVISLYYGRSLIATRYVEPITLARRESKLANVHMVTSLVRLSIVQSQLLRRQIADGRVRFELRSLFHTRLNLASFIKYSHWYTRHCIIVVSGPPTGVLIAKRC